jgi:putative chitinase
MNRDIFIDAVRVKPIGGMLKPGHVDGLTRILDEWERRNLTDLRWLAYMLATVYWETAHTIQPVREMGGEAYLRSKKYYPWVWEGLVQVTWEANHRKFGAIGERADTRLRNAGASALSHPPRHISATLGTTSCRSSCRHRT